MVTRRDVAAGTAVAGGAGLLAAPGAGVRAVNAAHRARVARQAVRAVGTTGALTREGKPVHPYELSGHRGERIPGFGFTGESPGRYPSAREAARTRYLEAAEPYHARWHRPPARGKAGALLVGGQVLTGAGLAGLGLHHFAGHNRNAVGKAEGPLVDPALSPMNLTAISPWRLPPVDPLQMHAASSIMAGVLAGAYGRHLTRGERKRLKRGAYRFVGAQHMVVTPTGMAGLVTP
jgi:hypothetical protein